MFSFKIRAREESVRILVRVLVEGRRHADQLLLKMHTPDAKREKCKGAKRSENEHHERERIQSAADTTNTN